MSNRRRPPADLATIKRSRAGFTGAITKALDRFKAIPCASAEEVLLINSKDVDRTLLSITRTESAFLQSLEDAQAFVPEEDEYSFQQEEEVVADSFSSAISATRDMGDQLLCQKAVLNGLSNFTCDLEAIQATLSSKPDSNQMSELRDLREAFTSLRNQWQAANLPQEHPIKTELDSCKRALTTLGADVTAASDKSDSHSTTSSSSTSSSPCYIIGKNDLPTIAVPNFSGDILEWSSFWASFKSTIQDRKELSNTQRLHYLRQAISNPELQLLLHSPAETDGFYQEVVDELKERFEKTREIHRLLSRTLADIPSPKQNRTELRRLVDLVKRTVSSLKATGQYDMDSFLSSIVVSILPSRLQTSWAQHTRKDKGVPPITALLGYLREHAETLPATTATSQPVISESSSKKPPPRRQDKKQEVYKPKPVHTISSSNSYRWECAICKPEKHPLHQCPKWATYTVPQRLAHIQSKSLCSNCLAGGHLTGDCKSTYRCRDCHQAHHTSIHQQQTTNTVNASSSQSSQVPDALMTTAQVLLTGPRGQSVKARALIDSGAGLSIISNRVANILDLPLESTKLQLSVAQGEQSKPIRHLTNVVISPIQNKDLRIPCKAAVAPTVTCDLPPQSIKQITDLPHLMGLQLADPAYHVPGRIDILLGADMTPKIMVKQLLRDGLPSQPIAQATHFGWVVSGPVTALNPHAVTSTSNYHQTPIIQTEEKLEPLIKQFWLSEEPEPEELPRSAIEDQVEGHFDQTVKYLPEQSRYEVTLPKSSILSDLGASRPQAMSRFLSNDRSLIRRNIRDKFQDVMKQYFILGHAEPVPKSELCLKPHFYMPMHAVFKDSSTTTKLRVVFDGSAITTSGISLNQALLVGPTIQPTLSNLLIRFRTYPVALNADISKMYREVQLSPEDKDLHRFLWRDDIQDPVTDYRMTRVTFGVSASPYLAVKTLQQAAADHGEEYPRASHHIRQSFYVDDFLGGADTPQEAVELFHNLRTILNKGSFSLCKWRSSSPAVLQEIPVDLQEAQPVKTATSSNSAPSKALGLQWNSQVDTMSPSITIPSHYTATKRGLVSDVAKTYDILGWIAPAILTMKLMFQQLWRTGQDWDDPVPSDILNLHKNWRDQLSELAVKRLPRCYSSTQHKFLHQELHGFSDASKGAYGAVLYCRTVYHDHPPTVSIVTAKTKVAKLEPPTIPRLELCGAKLLTQIIVNTAKILQIPANDWHCWTDSAIILAWLDGRDRAHPVFVQNRVRHILQFTQPSNWHHVPTADNPADCASRGITPRELLHHYLWWEGPPWLKENPVPMPKQPPRKELLEHPSVNTVTQTQYTLAENICNMTNQYALNISTAAWTLKFIHNLRDRPPKADNPSTLPVPVLSGTERRQAEIWLLKQAQIRLFSPEREAILKGKQFPRSSRLKALHPFLDKHQLLRVGGRLANSNLSLSQQQPVIADARDPFIQHFFKHLHVTLCHCGPSLLLCHAGRKIHVLGARRLSRAICSQCIPCRRRKPHLQHQLMGELPSPRVTPTAPFTHTGMDFAGPFVLKKGHTRRPVKIEVFICIFICLSVKAVHLEVVSDQTTAAFKAALQRFISRRSCPVHLYSDNGSNFVGAKNDLKRLYRLLHQPDSNQEIQHFLSTHHQITWHNSPPRSPHFGGLWESAVKSMKSHLKTTMGNSLLTFEEMTTVVCQVEACMNSRPLLPLTSHTQDGLATLTASHFLLHKEPTFFPEDARTPERPDLLKGWNHCQVLVQHFWIRWSREYLNQLQARTKWQKEQPNLQPEDIVILRPEKSHFSGHWPLGRITQVFPGQDNLVRVVLVKTATGTYKRAVTRLSLLFRPSESNYPPEPPSDQHSLQEAVPQLLPPGVCPDRNATSAGQPTAAAAQPLSP